MKEDINDCIPLITHHFELKEGDISTDITLFQLEQKLTQVIRYLLDKDMSRLMSAFYKIDLSEDLFKRIITTAPTDEISSLLAKEVIKRELKKVATRRKYRD
ncbi:MAG: hypothetical protein OCD76_09250 [Reichenbachiella sp.]